MELLPPNEESELKIEHIKLYVEHGFKLIHLHYPREDGTCSCGSVECSSIGKHPIQAGWTDKGQDNLVILTTRWTNNPEDNIGVLTGKVSNLLVVDIDSVEGQKIYDELSKDDPPTLRQITGKGHHYLYRYPADLADELGGKIQGKIRILDGVDLLSDGRFIVAAPSLHAGGVRYILDQGCKEIAETPGWLKDLIRNSGKKPKDVQKNNSTGMKVVEKGKRNGYLFNVASILRNKDGSGYDLIHPYIIGLNEQICSPPLGEDEVRTICLSACNYVPDIEEDEEPHYERAIIEDKDGRPKSWSPTTAADEFLKYNHVVTTPAGCTYIYDSNAYRFLDEVNDVHLKFDLIGGDTYKLNAKRETLDKIKTRSYKNLVMNPNPYMITVNDCSINLLSGEVKDFSPTDYISFSHDINYDPKAECPEIIKFLVEVTSSPYQAQTLLDSIAASFVKEMFPVFLLLVGKGSNGKGTFEKLVKRALKKDYTRIIDFSLMQRNQFASNDVVGALAIFATEMSGTIKEINWLKAYGGGDGMRVEEKFGKARDEYPFGVPFLDANELPRFEDESYGFTRRFFPIYFINQYTDNPKDGELKKDVSLLDKLTSQEELSGLLNLIIEISPRIIKSNTILSEKTGEEKKKEYNEKAYSLQNFFDKFCIIPSDDGDFCSYSTKFSILFEKYKIWCEELGVSPESDKKFSKYISRNFKLQSFQKKVEGKNDKYFHIKIDEDSWMWREVPLPINGYHEKNLKDSGVHQSIIDACKKVKKYNIVVDGGNPFK